MAKGWTCARCSTENAESTLMCTSCGLIRGSVVPDPRANPQHTSWSAGSEADSHGTEAGPGDEGTATASADGQPASDTSQWDRPTESRSILGRLPWGWVIVIVLVAGGAIVGLIFNATRSATGEIDRSGDLTVTDLRVGDCFDLKSPDEELIDTVTARPCTEEHEYELYFVESMPAGSFPTPDDFLGFIEERCLPAFESYVGLAYADSILDIFWFEPSQEAWTSGDRAIQCAVYHPRNHRLTESLKGSQR